MMCKVNISKRDKELLSKNYEQASIHACEELKSNWLPHTDNALAKILQIFLVVMSIWLGIHALIIGNFFLEIIPISVVSTIFNFTSIPLSAVLIVLFLIVPKRMYHRLTVMDSIHKGEVRMTECTLLSHSWQYSDVWLLNICVNGKEIECTVKLGVESYMYFLGAKTAKRYFVWVPGSYTFLMKESALL